MKAEMKPWRPGRKLKMTREVRVILDEIAPLVDQVMSMTEQLGGHEVDSAGTAVSVGFDRMQLKSIIADKAMFAVIVARGGKRGI